MYQKVCIPLMQIDSNVYAFLSGILVSLSTNIFTTLCFESVNQPYTRYYYISTLLLTIASALCMYISVKVAKFQSFIAAKNITDINKKISIILDITEKRKKRWIACYSLFIILLIASFTMLFAFR
jgi:hypothetical protein